MQTTFMGVKRLFGEFYNPFQILGFASPIKAKHKIQIILKLAIVISITFAYCTGIVYVLIKHSKNRDNVSQISNYLQLGANSFALIIIIGYPYVKIKKFSIIVEEFYEIDKNFSYHNYAKDLRQFRIQFILCSCVIISSAIYDCYTNCHFSSIPVWYWIVTYFPIIIISYSLFQVNFLIVYLGKRLQFIENFIIELHTTCKNSCLLASIASDIQFPNIVNVKETNDEIHAEQNMKLIYDGIRQIAQIAESISNIFGLQFFATFAALFTTTNIQTYYVCYITIYYYSFKTPPLQSFFASLLMVISNCILIIITATICENVNKKVSS